MRIFLAGATGVIGRRLAALLRDAKHEVAGTTRTRAKIRMLQTLGVTPIVVDVLDAGALARAVATVRPEIVIHQLTDLPSAPGTPGYPAAQETNRRLRIEGAHAALLAIGKGAGIYNIAEDDAAVSGAKAKRELGFDPAFRIA
jgi:uncharacterized protein YbjT (DUF2867 family)